MSSTNKYLNKALNNVGTVETQDSTPITRRRWCPQTWLRTRTDHAQIGSKMSRLEHWHTCFVWLWAISMVLLIPNTAFACGMSAMGAGYDAIYNSLFTIAGLIFLAGYLPYLGSAIALTVIRRKGGKPRAALKVIGSGFALLNTLVFVSAVGFVATIFSPAVFLGDLFLWGVPFGLFMYGSRA